MKLENEFTVPVSLEDAWKVLLDVERVAPCMPGATLLTHDGDEFTGTVKVKVGPIQVTYKGNAKFVQRDESTHRAVIEASGREARGSGTAAATVTTSLHEAGESTRVLVETDLNVTGRPAQFGRGVMSEVATKLIGQFADCLSQEVTAGSPPVEAPKPAPRTAGGSSPAGDAVPVQPSTSPSMPPTSGGMTEPAPAPPTPMPHAQEPRTGAPTPVAPVERKPHHASEVIDLVESAGGSIAKRLWPVAVALLLFVIWRRRRRD